MACSVIAKNDANQAMEAIFACEMEVNQMAFSGICR